MTDRPRTPFGEIMSIAVERRGESLRAFAERAGAYVQHLSAIIHGDRKPPLEHVGKWADALGLRGAERERFVLLAELEHAPEGVRRYVEKLERAAERKRP